MIRTNNRFLHLLLFLSISLSAVARQSVTYYIKDSLKYCIKEYRSDTVAMVMAVADSVRLPVTEDGTLVIPASVTLEGRTYKVKGPATDGFLCHPEIRHLVFSEGVTNVEWKSFSYCLNLESIHIPTTVTWVAPSAFDGCSNLRSITVEKGNAKYDSRNNCNAIIETSNNTLVQGCANTIIPTEIKTIGSSAFEDQQVSDSLILPQGVKGIGHYAFRGMTLPSNYAISEGITSIGEHAFKGCNLSRLILPSTLREIKADAFGCCHNLQIVETASTALHIGQYAFDHCTSLSAVRLPLNVTFESDNAFRSTPYQEVYEREHGDAKE